MRHLFGVVYQAVELPLAVDRDIEAVAVEGLAGRAGADELRGVVGEVACPQALG
jgi:hypothetical protein